MPLTPAFSMSQSALSPSSITATDTSTGSDASIAVRRIYFQTNDGNYLVESGTITDYEVWAYADASATFDILSSDYAISVTVQWLDSSNIVLYTLTQIYCFAEYNKQFFYYLVQQQATTPSILQDSSYATNMATYWTFITGAIQAVEIGADISASQNCLNQATNMMNNSTFYF